jgi:signal transduction histidine kinase
VVRDVLVHWRPAAGVAGLDVVEDLTPTVINGDPVLVEILVDNLVRNAITHNQRGGLLRVRTDVGVLLVENTSAELSPQRLAELTEPFRQGAHDRTGDTEGAGLGLAIVDTVAKAHNGSLRLLARQGGGVVATVSFPLNFC